MTVKMRSSRSSLRYLIDEETISDELGFPVAYPIRVFSLEGFGIDQKSFLKYMAPTFSLCPRDEYVVKLGQVNFLKRIFPEECPRLDSFLCRYYANEATLESVFDLVAMFDVAQRQEFERIRIGGRRHRSAARYSMTRQSGIPAWNARRVSAEDFHQEVQKSDPRSYVRVFQEMSEVVTGYPGFQTLLQCLAEMVYGIRPGVRELQMNVHQMVVYADVLADGNNAPEGVHQDGSDYIVSALVIERAGIIGGDSTVYGPRPEYIGKGDFTAFDANRMMEYLAVTLHPGMGLFQADDKTPLWHNVTLVKENPSIPPPYGSRSIIGFDTKILKES